MKKHFVFFAPPTHQKLAKEVARAFRQKLSPLTIDAFADEETYVNVTERRERIAGAHVVIVATGAPKANDRFVELLFLLDALRAYRPKRVTVVLSFYPYRRQERKVRPGESVSARIIARLLESAGADDVVVVELHTPKIQEFFSIPVHEVTTMPLFYQYFKKKVGKRSGDWVVIAPDHGITKACLFLAGTLGIQFLQSYKHRTVHDKVIIDPLRGDVRGKHVILLDDEIDTGQTMIANVRQIRRHHPKSIFIAGTHGIFASSASRRFMQDPLIREVVTTDTIPLPKEKQFSKLKTLSVAPLLTKALLHL